MKGSIQNGLRKSEQRILRRLEGSREDRGQPRFAASNIRVELADKVRAIGVGGIGLVHQLARKVGLVKAVDRRVPLLKIHLRQHVMINCWHMNDYESGAMWRVCGKTDEAVVICSTYELLDDALDDSVFLGIVKYIDYETQLLPDGSVLERFVHKRKYFSYEQELRAVLDKSVGATEESLDVDAAVRSWNGGAVGDSNVQLLIQEVPFFQPLRRVLLGHVADVLADQRLRLPA